MISNKYSAVIHCGTIRQSAKIILGNGEQLKVGDKGLVEFEFQYDAEFLEPNMIFFFREGMTRGVGIIKKIYPITNESK